MPPRTSSAARLSFRISRYGVKGDESPRLPSGLPAALRLVGLPRYEPVCTALRRAVRQVSLPDKEFRLSLTRHAYDCALERMTCLVGCTPTSSLHVAMQTGPSLHPVSWMLGVWPLRILMRSCLGLRRFIV